MVPILWFRRHIEVKGRGDQEERKMNQSDFFHCAVCRKDYPTPQTNMLEWAITPDIRVVWCEYCDAETDDHQGLHKWQGAFMESMVMAIQHLSKVKVPS